MRIVNLASGSKGNSTLIETTKAKVLLDCGLSLPQLSMRLQSVGVKIEEIDAIVITHEHIDHIRCLVQFLKKYDARAYVPKTIFENYLKDAPALVKSKISAIEEYRFSIFDLTFMPFSLPHDSMVCFGYMVSHENKRVAFATDLGYMPDSVLKLIEGSDLVYIESNHDKKLLLACSYPYIVKQRIMGERGHLSNAQAAEIVCHLAKKGTRYFVLSHMSENSNTLEAAYIASARALEDNGFVIEKDIFLRYSRQDRVGNNFYF